MILVNYTINEKKFVLVKNSLIEAKVETLINPALKNLTQGRGVAGHISRKRGPGIQIKSHKKASVKTGSRVFSGASNLQGG